VREIVFYHSGEIQPFVLRMIESVRKNFDLPLTQMTDLKTKAIKTVDAVIRKDYGPLALSRIAHMRDYEHDELLMLDTDLIVKRNVEEVFGKEFDVALTKRSLYEVAGKQELKKGQPYNSGVVFSRSNEFWNKCLEWLAPRKKHHKWAGEQRAINYVALNDDFDVLDLKCPEYNWTPNKELMESDAAIWHYKGNRKRWI